MGFLAALQHIYDLVPRAGAIEEHFCSPLRRDSTEHTPTFGASSSTNSDMLPQSQIAFNREHGLALCKPRTAGRSEISSNDKPRFPRAK